MGKVKKVSPWLMLYIVIFFIYSIYPFVRPGDDVLFEGFQDKISFFNYLSLRYLTWSSRIVPDAVAYYIFHSSQWLWKGISSFSVIILGYSISRITVKKVNFSDVLIGVLSLGYFSYDIIFSSFFWTTNSINYLWPLSIAAYGMTMFSDSFFHKDILLFNFENVIRISAIAIASFSNEQFLVTMCGVATIYTILMLYRRIKVPLVAIISMIWMLLGSVFVLSSPGNAIRRAKEIQIRMPDFNEVSVAGHIRISFQWFFQLFYQNFLTLSLLVILLSLLLITEKKVRCVIFANLAILSSVLLTMYTNGRKINFMLLRKSELYNITIFSSAGREMILPYLLSIFLFFSLWISGVIASRWKAFSLLLLLGGFSSMLFITFSPTMYESGQRVLLCGAFFISIIVYQFSKDIIGRKQVNKKVFIIIFAIYPIINLLVGIRFFG